MQDSQDLHTTGPVEQGQQFSEPPRESGLRLGPHQTRRCEGHGQGRRGHSRVQNNGSESRAGGQQGKSGESTSSLPDHHSGVWSLPLGDVQGAPLHGRHLDCCKKTNRDKKENRCQTSPDQGRAPDQCPLLFCVGERLGRQKFVGQKGKPARGSPLQEPFRPPASRPECAVYAPHQANQGLRFEPTAFFPKEHETRSREGLYDGSHLVLGQTGQSGQTGKGEPFRALLGFIGQDGQGLQCLAASGPVAFGLHPIGHDVCGSARGEVSAGRGPSCFENPGHEHLKVEGQDRSVRGEVLGDEPGHSGLEVLARCQGTLLDECADLFHVEGFETQEHSRSHADLGLAQETRQLREATSLRHEQQTREPPSRCPLGQARQQTAILLPFRSRAQEHRVQVIQRHDEATFQRLGQGRETNHGVVGSGRGVAQFVYGPGQADFETVTCVYVQNDGRFGILSEML